MIIKKSHFRYNSRQRNGVFVLGFLLVFLQLVLFFADFSSNDTVDLDDPAIKKFEQEMDSLRQRSLVKNEFKLYPFNPSFISDYKGYQLGLSIEEIDRLLAHRAQGRYINSTQEFQEISGVSDSLLALVSPYFKFPKWIANQAPQFKKLKTKNKHLTFLHNDLNKLRFKDLENFSSLSKPVAKRILKYRERLGGYSFNEQLFEVYGLKSEQAHEILTHFKVQSKPEIIKLNVNKASFKQLLSIVYLDYELTKKIFEFRDEVAEIQSLEELKQIEGFPVDKFDRIAVYLQTN